MNPLRRLTELGQSVWYDSIRRDLYQGPELSRLIEDDDLRGMTSNPTIFASAIVETDLYDDDIAAFSGNGASPDEIFDALVIEDVRGAADVFRPVYESTGGADGFVSIEVGPQFARDTAASLAEARRLWRECDRPNVMVKIPATAEGIPAIRQCLVDTAAALRGKVAIANAQIAHETFKNTFNTARFRKLTERGAHLQRPLWASTSTKNPAYPDLYYVEALIGPNSVDTMPPETFAAYRDHGRPEVRIHHELPEARTVFRTLEQLGIDFDRIALELEEEGARQFVASYDEVLQAIREKQGAFALG